MLKQSAAKRCNERERGDQIKLPGRRGPGCTAGLIDHNYHPICFVPGIFPPCPPHAAHTPGGGGRHPQKCPQFMF